MLDANDKLAVAFLMMQPLRQRQSETGQRSAKRENNMTKIRPIVCAVAICLPAIAEAQFFDRLRYSDYDRNVTTCWNALVESGRIRAGKISDYHVRYEYYNKRIIVQFDGAAWNGFKTANCALDRSGRVTHMLPGQ